MPFKTKEKFESGGTFAGAGEVDAGPLAEAAHHEVDDLVLVVALHHVVERHRVGLVDDGDEDVEDDEGGGEAEDEVEERAEPPVDVAHLLVNRPTFVVSATAGVVFKLI